MSYMLDHVSALVDGISDQREAPQLTGDIKSRDIGFPVVVGDRDIGPRLDIT